MACLVHVIWSCDSQTEGSQGFYGTASATVWTAALPFSAPCVLVAESFPHMTSFQLSSPPFSTMENNLILWLCIYFSVLLDSYHTLFYQWLLLWTELRLSKFYTWKSQPSMWVYLEMGSLRRWLRLNEAIRMKPWSHRTGVFIRREGHSRRLSLLLFLSLSHSLCKPIEERPWQDITARWPPTSQNETYHQKQNLLPFWTWISSHCNCRK